MTESEKLHQRSVVIDAHCDTLQLIADQEYVFGERHEAHHLDLPRMREGGITAQIFAVYVGPVYLPGQATNRALQLMDAFHQTLEAYPDDLRLVTQADDILAAKREDKVGMILGLEGAEALAGDLRVLRMMHKLGLRNLGLTWNFRNQAADGVGEERTGGGLTRFGVSLVEEMNRLGIVIDIAHLSPASVADVLAVSQAPIIASHANARALNDNDYRRNLTDAQLEKIAENGGVVGITFVPAFLDADPDMASLSSVADHMEHMMKVMGEDHVGLGSDFDGFRVYDRPIGLEDASKMPAITTELLRRGHSEATVQKILGGNFLRVFREVMG